MSPSCTKSAPGVEAFGEMRRERKDFWRGKKKKRIKTDVKRLINNLQEYTDKREGERNI